MCDTFFDPEKPTWARNLNEFKKKAYEWFLESLRAIQFKSSGVIQQFLVGNFEQSWLIV